MDDMLIPSAAEYARHHHRHQSRKYTDEPYFAHCEEVAGLIGAAGYQPEVVVAAYLHDVVEDAGVTYSAIESLFGRDVMELVFWVTEPICIGNRAIRKHLAKLHYAAGPPEAKAIKCADLISNVRGIVAQDPDFAGVYLIEKRALHSVLNAVNYDLYHTADDVLHNEEMALEDLEHTP